MRPVYQNYEAQNEYTSPLEGNPYYRNSGVIYALDRSGRKYAVSRIDFERYDEQNFQYIFSPEWSVIDSLPATIFQGIPGLDMSLRLEQYYRVNMTPYFISERTPSEGREDLWELLEEVGLDIDFTGVRPAVTVAFLDGWDDFYVVHSDERAENLVIQLDEVQAVKWASLEEVLALREANQFMPYTRSFLEYLFFRGNHVGSHDYEV